jgi:Transposase IS116/IS110/IS902 family
LERFRDPLLAAREAQQPSAGEADCQADQSTTAKLFHNELHQTSRFTFDLGGREGDEELWEAGILSAILAPTDGGLGAIIVNSPRVPMRIRQALNVEAGLNDGLSVPFLLMERCGNTSRAPTAIREQRRTLRYRNLLVRQMVQTKIKISTLLMEAGVSYNKRKLHKAGYFRELLASNPEINESLRSLLRQCREMVVRLGKMESALIHSLQQDPLLVERVERLMSIPGIGPITALTWALEIGEVQRFSSTKKAISYCGLCGDEKDSGNTVQRTPLSKQRNKHLQTTLIEAAKMVLPRWRWPGNWWPT